MSSGNNPDSSSTVNPDSSFGYGLNYNPMDPLNMYPHHETGEEVYGPPPLFGINKHDPFNMKPFNPNVFASLAGATVPAPINTIGPNPFTPLLQPMTPSMPMYPAADPAAPIPGPPPAAAPVGVANPLLLAAAMNAFGDSSFAPGSGPGPSAHPAASAAAASSATVGADPSSSYFMNPYAPYFLDPFATHLVAPQYAHPTDPNNQYPNPLNGSMTQPGPALAGGYNAYDPQNLIGAPPVFSERERAIEHNRAAMQPQSPYAPYRMHQVPVPPPASGPAS